ncbi:hypothetical protein [Arthrobacter monumenti]
MGNKPPTEIAVELNKLANSIVRIHGGKWTYNDGAAWQPEATDGYRGTPCGDASDVQRFSQSLLGPGADDLQAAAAKIKEHFLDREFTVTNQFKDEAGIGKYIQLSMRAENGASFAYTVGETGSGLIVDSECSTHRDMDQITK